MTPAYVANKNRDKVEPKEEARKPGHGLSHPGYVGLFKNPPLAGVVIHPAQFDLLGSLCPKMTYAQVFYQ